MRDDNPSPIHFTPLVRDERSEFHPTLAAKPIRPDNASCDGGVSAHDAPLRALELLFILSILSCSDSTSLYRCARSVLASCLTPSTCPSSPWSLRDWSFTLSLSAPTTSVRASIFDVRSSKRISRSSRRFVE
nr:MAG TPA: hypothetical protein [Caudoviricetes sp.]